MSYHHLVNLFSISRLYDSMYVFKTGIVIKTGINVTKAAVVGTNHAGNRTKEFGIPMVVTAVVSLSTKVIL